MFHILPLNLKKVLDLILILSLVTASYLILRIVMDHFWK